jgi:hypothetical protein
MGRGDDEPAIQMRGQVGRAGRSSPGTAGSQDARCDQRGRPVGHRHHSTGRGGFTATNPPPVADGARYEVRPDRLTISSNGNIDSSEPPLEYADSR